LVARILANAATGGLAAGWPHSVTQLQPVAFITGWVFGGKADQMACKIGLAKKGEIR